MRDPLDDRWCCMTCASTFRIGECWTKPPAGRPPVMVGDMPALYCPQCGSSDLHPASGGVEEIEEYVGEIGVRH